MNGNKPDKTKHQKGISCAVCSCAYHDGDCYCCADKIQVGPASVCACLVGSEMCIRDSFLRGTARLEQAALPRPGTLEGFYCVKSEASFAQDGGSAFGPNLALFGGMACLYRPDFHASEAAG